MFVLVYLFPELPSLFRVNAVEVLVNSLLYEDKDNENRKTFGHQRRECPL